MRDTEALLKQCDTALRDACEEIVELRERLAEAVRLLEKAQHEIDSVLCVEIDAFLEKQ